VGSLFPDFGAEKKKEKKKSSAGGISAFFLKKLKKTFMGSFRPGKKTRRTT